MRSRRSNWKVVSTIAAWLLAAAPAALAAGPNEAALGALLRLRGESERAFESRPAPGGGHFEKLMGGLSRPYSGAPEDMARDFLFDHGAALGLATREVADLALAYVKAGTVTHHVRFDQTVAGHPVHGAFVFVHLRGDRIQQVDSTAVPGLALEPTNATLAGADAIEIVARSIGAEAPLRGEPSARLGVGGDVLRGRLSYEVTIPAWRPLGDFVALVDTESGKVGPVRDVLVRVDGTGRVFDPNPVATSGDTSLADGADADTATLTAQRIVRTLTDLDGSGLLRGPFCDTRNSAVARANEPTLVYNYTRSDERFEEVTTYYAITHAQRYFQDTLGVAHANNRQQVLDVHGIPDDNSFYSPATKEITLGDGGVDDAEDAEVVLHEYGHAIQDDQVPGWGSTHEGGSMGEAFGDYIAASITDDPARPGLIGAACVADWDAVSYSGDNPPCLRRTDGSKVYPGDMVGEVHADGEIWSAALWEIRAAIGREAANTLVLEHHLLLTPSAEFADGAQALLTADENLTGGANRGAIVAALVNHGLLPPPACLPGTVNAGTPPAFFTDTIEGGGGNFTTETPSGTPGWAIVVDPQASSPTHSWFSPDTTTVKDDRLVLGARTLPADRPTALRFRHRYDFESGWDGGVLEMSVNGGAFADAGSRIVAGGYDGALRSSGNPLQNRSAWTGQRSAMTLVTVDLAGLEGASVRFMWRLGCDASVGATGWHVDDVMLTDAGGGSVTDVLFVNRRAATFQDDIESGGGAFTTAIASGAGPWQIVASPVSHSPTHSWSIASTEAVKDATLTLENVALGPNPTTLVFWHQFDTESGYDGGRLFIREEPAGAYVDLGPRIVDGGYDGTLASGNPMGAGAAWTGTNGAAMTAVVVDVSDRPNQTVDIRWRFACDSSVSRGPWLVDDVSFGSDPGNGGADRTVDLGVATPFRLDIDAAPGGPAAAKFVVYRWNSAVDLATETPLPFGIGALCFPMRLTGGTPQPDYIWSNVGKPNKVGVANEVPPLAPTTLANDLDGLGAPMTFTVQGIIADRFSAGAKKFSVTNAVIVRVQ